MFCIIYIQEYKQTKTISINTASAKGYKKPIFTTKSAELKFLTEDHFWKPVSHSEPGVVACTCNPATLEAEFRNVVGSIQVGVTVLR